MAGALGRIKPPDTAHIEKYPITALAPELQPTHVPVVLGINWFTAFDRPTKDSKGVWHLASKRLGTVRGGHCVCLEPAKQPIPGGEQDVASWWPFYNQGVEGACEGFGHARAMSLLFREKFDAFWLYDDARRIEGAFPQGEGSTNRSACAALVQWGAHFEAGSVCHRSPWQPNKPGKQIKSYHWCTTVDQVRSALGYDESVSEFPLLNSWGTAYPEVTMLPDVTLDRLLAEEGEADVFQLL